MRWTLHKSPGQINIDTKKVGNEIQVSITDNGKGIQPENMTRIFEPFFTTKAPRKGYWLRTFCQPSNYQAARRSHPGGKPGGSGEQIHRNSTDPISGITQLHSIVKTGEILEYHSNHEFRYFNTFLLAKGCGRGWRLARSHQVRIRSSSQPCAE